MSTALSPLVDVRSLLALLRPVDIAVALHVHLGDPLKVLPPLPELAAPEARSFWLAAFSSLALSFGHTGLPLSGRLRDFLPDADLAALPPEVTFAELLGTGSMLVQNCPMGVTTPGSPSGGTVPMVYRQSHDVLYLRRWYELEAAVGARLRERLHRSPNPLPDGFAEHFRRAFPRQDVETNPWQAAACLTALRHDLGLITGGPGTGKTTTVARLIVLLLQLPPESAPRLFALAAPTGKAADRMREALRDCFERVLENYPAAEASVLRARFGERVEAATTLHGLLGARGGARFMRDADNPLSADVVIVDEASMADLVLMHALLQALPQQARVILLGDAHQLSAVESGNVFSDLIGRDTSELNQFSAGFQAEFAEMTDCELPARGKTSPRLGDHVVALEFSYRFAKDSAIARLAAHLLNKQRLPTAEEAPGVLHWLDDSAADRVLQGAIAPVAQAMKAKATPAEVLGALGQCRILVAIRGGTFGAEAINERLCRLLTGAPPAPEVPRHGLPFIVTRNDRALGLANGDCGIFLRKGSALRAWLPAAEGEGAVRALDPTLLPQWEPAFALTIHKAQGSEYDRVCVVLPEVRRGFVSWELVYTAVTRARQEVTLLIPRASAGAPLPKAFRASGLEAEFG